MSRARLLELCGGEGGASQGYADAGFEVVGVDINPQPRYPHRFIQADALDVLRDRAFVETFDAIHASWPCQGFKKGTLWSDKPDLVTPGRELMSTYAVPWVIENVMEAPLDRDRSIVLCANAFGLRTYRHRRFEPSPGLTLIAPPHLPHVKRAPNRRRRERWLAGDHASITGDVGTYVGPEAMGIDWMTGNGLSEAVPPAYTRWVGVQLLDALGHRSGLSGATPEQLGRLYAPTPPAPQPETYAEEVRHLAELDAEQDDECDGGGFGVGDLVTVESLRHAYPGERYEIREFYRTGEAWLEPCDGTPTDALLVPVHVLSHA